MFKVISSGNNNCIQKLNKWMKYRNVLPNHKYANMGSPAMHLRGVCKHDRYANSKFITKTYFYMI